MAISSRLTVNNRIKAKTALIRAALAAAVDDAGLAVAERARELAPVETGELRDSIHYDRDLPDGGTVRADAPYAAYVELGTVHMAAEPYLTPALMQVTQDFASVAKLRIRKDAG